MVFIVQFRVLFCPFGYYVLPYVYLCVFVCFVVCFAALWRNKPLAPHVKVTNLSFASEQMQAAKFSQFHGLLSSDDSDRQRGVAKSITLSISAIQTATPDVDTGLMSINRCSPSLMSISCI